MLRIPLLICLAICATSIGADEVQRLSVLSRIYVDDVLVASPGMVVYGGQETSMVISNTLALSLVATERDENTVEVSARLDVRGNQFKPTVLTPYGEEATVRMGTTAFTVIVNRLEAADDPQAF